MLPQVEFERILKVDNFENVAYVCCDGIRFRGSEWGVDHICGVEFDDLSDEAIKELDEFIASFRKHQVTHTLAVSTQTLSLLNMKNLHIEHPEDSILTGDLSVLDAFQE